MSHSIEYYQGMSTEQLIREMNHAHWTVDRQRARRYTRRGWKSSAGVNRSAAATSRD